MIDFSSVKMKKNTSKGYRVEELSSNDIAIIGIAVKLPKSNSIEEFWKVLRDGVDCIGEIPDSRKPDIIDALNIMNIPLDSLDQSRAALLDEVDKFDYNFFKLSPKESSLMDPNQRLFLETAWEAIEDSGYGGEKLKGSRTGVFLGFNSDSEYKKLVSKVEPSCISMALPGNVKPIVASRLSYLMDFKGPSMIVDTTCSSSLVAVHLAVRSIRSGECDMAVVGGVQLHLMPVRETKIGVESSNWRAKTFDASSDGTGTGEGVIAMIIKPLWKAQKDRDNVYAIIKGSSINHDGNSNGLTAPNAAAQADVIVRGWEDAGVNPETITYIEAHGTGTKLGDPIEIDGIQKAFTRFTDRKQFCAIGAVKTNIGHLDSSSGIVGLLKAVLSLKYKELVPSLHFKRPNPRIDFEDSPVYVNDKLSKWITDGFPRRCGVSSFGLSGTNCHVILEEAPEISEVRGDGDSSLQVLTLSARSESVLKHLINKYKAFLNTNRDIDMGDLCYTANTGRAHFPYRMAIIFQSREELMRKIKHIEFEGFENIKEQNIYYSEIIKDYAHDKNAMAEEISGSESYGKANSINSLIEQFIEANSKDLKMLQEICIGYAKGAQIDWERIYSGERRRRVRIPTYPFERKRCWIDLSKWNLISRESRENRVSTEQLITQTGKPLLDKCITKSPWLEVYSTAFNIDRHWVLNEHKIDGNCVLVGTTHLEMVMEACLTYFPKGACFEEVQFLNPLFVKPGDTTDTQLVLERNNNSFKFYVASKFENSDNIRTKWIKHVEGSICEIGLEDPGSVDIDNIKLRCNEDYIVPDIESYNALTSFEFGPRWKNIKEIFTGKGELISYIEMPSEFTSELKDYPLHPSMLDNALATIPLLNKILSTLPDQKKGDSIYLPFGYKGIKIFRPLPERFYSHVRIKEDIHEKSEIAKFSIDFIDLSGNVFVKVEEYSLKKARKSKLGLDASSAYKNLYFKTNWILENRKYELQEDIKGCAVIFKDKKGISLEIEEKLKGYGWSTISVDMAGVYSKTGEDNYTVGAEQEDYYNLFRDIQGRGITHIFHMATITGEGEPESLEALGNSLNSGLYSLFHLSRAVLASGIKNTLSMVFVTEYANDINGEGILVKAENAAVFGLGKVLHNEYSNMKFKGIDIDGETPMDIVYNELLDMNGEASVALRKGMRYVEELGNMELDEVSDREFRVQENGVYLITGGAGGIGLEIAKFLATKNRVNLVLVGRSQLPPRNEWDINSDGQGTHKLQKGIKAIREIEQLGSKVEYFSGDVSSKIDMEKVFAHIKNTYKKINGVIHSAGIAGDGFIIRKDENSFKEVISPKIQGTWILHNLTKSEELDFFVLFSSNNTLAGMPGQGDYTAANCYLDSFTYYRNSLGKETITINWPAWKETGMAFEHGVATDGFMKPITTTEALSAFEKVLGKSIKRVVIGELNYSGSLYGYGAAELGIRLSDEIKQKIKNAGNSNTSQVKHKDIQIDSVKLKGKSKGEYTQTEKSIASIWKEVLGYDEFNINDSFFEIGGDSIMITRVHNFIEEKYPGKVQVGDLFAYPTISKIASFISEDTASSKQEESKPDDVDKDIETDILALFEEVEKGNLSIDKAAEVIEGMKKNN